MTTTGPPHEGAGVHGPDGGHPDARHPRRHGLRGLVHQRAHRGPARAVAGVLKGRRVADGVGCSSSRGRPGAAAGRGRGSRDGLRAGRRRVAPPGCSMCLAMNPDQLAPERSASTSNRNFEGRQGKAGRTHLVSRQVAAATAIRGRCRAGPRTSNPSAPEVRRAWKPSPPTPGSGAVASQQCRHRPDHPGRVPQAGHPVRIRGRQPLRGVAKGRDVRPQRPVVCRGVGSCAGPDFGTGSSREHAVWALMNYGFEPSSRAASPTSSEATAGSRACSRPSAARTTWSCSGSTSEQPGCVGDRGPRSRTVTAGDIVARFESTITRWRLLEATTTSA